jgi:hypothetical protein
VVSALVTSHLGQLDHQAQGIANGSFTAKGLPEIGVQENEICTRVVAPTFRSAGRAPSENPDLKVGATKQAAYASLWYS